MAGCTLGVVSRGRGMTTCKIADQIYEVLIMNPVPLEPKM